MALGEIDRGITGIQAFRWYFTKKEKKSKKGVDKGGMIW